MFDSGLLKSMWKLAAEGALHIYNRTPHKSLGFETPLKKLAPETNCHLDKIRRFCCVAFVSFKTQNKIFRKSDQIHFSWIYQNRLYFMAT